MSLLKKLFVLLFLLGLFSTANAAIGEINTDACSVFSEADASDKGEDKKGGEEEEEEPDCE